MIGLLGYVAMPTAPPRLLGLGFADEPHKDGLVQLAANPYAAMPSLHAADALIVGIVLAFVCRHWWAKLFWAIWPAWVWFAVMATGNHFWLDCIAGVARRAGGAGDRLPPRHRPRSCRSASVGDRLPTRQATPADDAATVSRVSRAAAIKQGYTTGARRMATRSISGLARTRVTPDALTVSGVTLCFVASVLVLFEGHNELLFFWLGAFVFVAGSILDILDGALARAGGKSTVFGAFLDSTTDRVGEFFMLAAIAYVFARDGRDVFVVVAVAAVAGSLLVSYTRARAEALGLQGRRRHRLPGRARRRDHRRPRARAVGRPALGDRPAGRDRVDHGRPACPARPQATHGGSK